MPSPGPAHDYYAACRGRWRSAVALTVVDAEALQRSGMSLADRWSLRGMSRWPAWLGRVYLETTVAFQGEHEVVHTTVVRWLGLPLQRSVEIFTLDPDGSRLTVRGGMTGSGAVDPTGTEVDYTLTWLGVQIHQRTRREGDRVTVVQEGPGFSGVQHLERQAP